MLALLLTPLASANPAPSTTDFGPLAETAWRLRYRGRAVDEVSLGTEVFRWPAGARVRVSPVIEGLGVDGASWVVALNPRGVVRRISGPQIELEPVPVGPISAEAAVDVLAPVRSGLGEGELWAPRSDARYRVVDGQLHHTWRVRFSTASPPATWVSWVDSTTAEVLFTDRTSHAVGGSVYEGTPFDGDPQTVELAYLTRTATLTGTYSDVFSCGEWEISDQLFGENHCDSLIRRAWQVEGDFVYAPHPGQPDDPFAEVNLYHHVSEVSAFFDERYGLRAPDPITTIANFPMANAFFGDFDGDGVGDLSFGFTDEVQFAYDADVVYHEFGHSIVARIANIPSLGADGLGLVWAGGGLNEGAADVFSMLLTVDPDVGEYAGSAFRDGPIRALADDRTCPEGLAGQVHRDGEMLGSLGWNIIDAVGRDIAADLFFGAISTWGPDISWKLAGRSLLDSADDLEAAGQIDGEIAATIRGLVEASGLPGCERIIEVSPDQSVDAFVLSAGLEGELYRIPGGAQLAIEVPPDADRLIVDVTEFSAPEGLAWSIYIRRDEPVLMVPTELAAFGLGFATAVEWDWLVDGDEPVRLAFDGTSDPPLVPGGTYYVAVAGRDAGPIELFEFTQGRMTLDLAPFTYAEPARSCGPGLPESGALWGFLERFARRRRSR